MSWSRRCADRWPSWPSTVRTGRASGRSRGSSTRPSARIDGGQRGAQRRSWRRPRPRRARPPQTSTPRCARGEDPGPLAGVPFGVKDLEDCAGLPTSHGSLLFTGRPPVDEDSIHVGRLRAAGAVPARQDGRARVRHAPLHQDRRRGASPATRGTWPARPAARAAAPRPRWPPGWCRFATASDGGGSTRIPAELHRARRAQGRASVACRSDRREPARRPRSTARSTTTVRDAARHLDVAAGPDDCATARRCRAPAWSTSGRSRSSTRPGCGRGGRSTSASPPSTRRWPSSPRPPRPSWPSAAGLELDDEPVQLTDPVRTWLSSGGLDLWLDIEAGMWPSIADDLTRYSRSVLEQTQNLDAPSIAKRLRHGRSSSARWASSSARSTCCITPTTAVPAFAAEGPPPAEIAGVAVDAGHADAVHDARQPVLEPVDVGARRALERGPPGRAHAHRDPRTATTSRCAWPASWSRPAPGPAGPRTEGPAWRPAPGRSFRIGF